MEVRGRDQRDAAIALRCFALDSIRGLEYLWVFAISSVCHRAAAKCIIPGRPIVPVLSRRVYDDRYWGVSMDG